MENVFCTAGLRLNGEVLLVLLNLIVMMGGGVLGRFVVEKNSILVISPNSLGGKRDSAIGNFGVPKYGGSMIGNVVYTEKGASACTSFKELGVSFNQHKSPPTPLILLADRGGCFFAMKAWNAQNAGAAAVLVADDREEPLETMDSPEDSKGSDTYLNKISIPSVLIEKSFGDGLKNTLKNGEMVTVKLDWAEPMPHPGKRVEYEFWTNSNDECGTKCDDQIDFVRNFKGYAQILEKSGFTQFNPHYITWYCPTAYVSSKACVSQCINHGRYCAPDPESNFNEGYEGKDVVVENLRQLCVFRVANESNLPWVWWDYVTDFHTRCSMKDKKYNKECAESIIKSLCLLIDKVQECMGDPQADAENPVLEAEQDMQDGHGLHRGVTSLPTLLINNVQYRGKLERSAVLKSICALFKETTEPLICLSGAIETNECLTNNGGCWQNKKANITACKDTFRGRICECPKVFGVQFQGDGYSHCEAIGVGRCRIENGGCWSETENSETFLACSESQFSGCHCPTGFHGDGHKCEDIDECKGVSCQCRDCTCKNKWGGFDSNCKGDLLYLAEQDTCIDRNASRFEWFLILTALAGLVSIVVAGYVFYKYRLRSYMDTEIIAVISQYMTLDNQTDDHQPLQQNSI